MLGKVPIGAHANVLEKSCEGSISDKLCLNLHLPCVDATKACIEQLSNHSCFSVMRPFFDERYI